VYEHVQEQDQLQKEAWSRLLAHGGKQLNLELSPDFRGMQYAMPGIFLVFLVTAFFSARCARPPLHGGPLV
jgi:hypothetical protein